MPPPPERFHEIVIPQNMVKPVMGRPEPPKVIRFPRTQPAYVPTVEEVMLDELEQAAPAPEVPQNHRGVRYRAAGVLQLRAN